MDAARQKTLLARARAATETLVGLLADQIPITTSLSTRRVPFKVATLRELLAHRMAALAVPATTLLDKSNIVSGILLSRAALETVAILIDLDRELRSFLQAPDEEKLDKFLMNSIFANRHGEKGEMAEYQTRSIMYSIDRLDKDVKGIRFTYDALSEYCHPNWGGLHGSFGKVNPEMSVVDLGPRMVGEGFEIGGTALSASVEMFVACYNEMDGLIARLNAHFASS